MAKVEKQRIRILVVEDDDQWRDALVGMYKEIFGARTTEIIAIDNGPAALALLARRGNRYELLSCDYLLDKSHPRTAAGGIDLTIPGFLGHDVLDAASMSVPAAVVPTELLSREKIEFIDDNERGPVVDELGAWLKKKFPERHTLLHKQRGRAAGEAICSWQKSWGHIIQNLVLEADPSEVELSVRGGWLDYPNITEPTVEVRIAGRTVPLAQRPLGDHRFLFRIATSRAATFDEAASDYDVDVSGLRLKIDDLRRWIRKPSGCGIDPDLVFESTYGKGWVRPATLRIDTPAVADVSRLPKELRTIFEEMIHSTGKPARKLSKKKDE